MVFPYSEKKLFKVSSVEWTGRKSEKRNGAVSGFKEAVFKATRVLNEGGVIVIPTETMYGFSADSTSQKALEKIVRLKGRSAHAPFLLLAPDLDAVLGTISKPDDNVLSVLSVCWPGPVSFLLPATRRLHPTLTGPGGTVGVRVPGSGAAAEVCKEFGGLIVSTSVNKSGAPPLKSPEIIWREFGTAIDLMIDTGSLPSNVPSTIIDLTVEPPILVREGAFSIDKFQKLTGKVLALTERTKKRP